MCGMSPSLSSNWSAFLAFRPKLDNSQRAAAARTSVHLELFSGGTNTRFPSVWDDDGKCPFNGVLLEGAIRLAVLPVVTACMGRRVVAGGGMAATAAAASEGGAGGNANPTDSPMVAW